MDAPRALVVGSVDGARTIRLARDALAGEGIESVGFVVRPWVEVTEITAAVDLCDAVVLVDGEAGGPQVMEALLERTLDTGKHVYTAPRARSSRASGSNAVTFVERVRQIARLIHEAVAEQRRIDLTLHPPAERPGADDAGVVASEIEGLLGWAERFVADESHPEDLRDEVDARRRQLRDELRLIGQEKGSSAVLTGISAQLLPLVRPDPSDEGLGEALDEVADAVVALGEATSDDEIVAAGEDAAEALDHVGDEIAEILDAEDWDGVKAAWFRGMGRFAEEDFREHLNAFIVLARERLGPTATGAAGGAITSWMGGPPWLVVTVIALGLLRARFPWIFRREEDAQDGE